MFKTTSYIVILAYSGKRMVVLLERDNDKILTILNIVQPGLKGQFAIFKNNWLE